MKRQIALLCAFVLPVSLLAACGKPAAPGSGSEHDYKEIITATRSEEEGEMLTIITNAQEDGAEIILKTLALSEDMMQRYAVSISLVIVRVYGVAIILPAEGKQQQVVTALEAFIQSQKDSQSGYLPLQYEIAKQGRVKVAATGEVLLVMCENADDVTRQIEDALAA